MPFKTLSLACALVVLSSSIASAQVDFDELFSSTTLPQLPDGQLSEYGEIAPPASSSLVPSALDAPPPVPPPLDASSRRIDFETVFSADETAPTRLYHPAGSLVQPQPHAAVACAPHRCNQRPIRYLDYPNLPPPASLEGIYRTPACYRDLWGGYQQQRHHACRSHHQHLHGHCECLDPPHGHGYPPAASGGW